MIEKMTDKEYFEDREYITNSMLSWLIVSKRFFKKKFSEGPESDVPDYFKLGHAVHCYILEQEEFDKRFIVMRQSAPSNAKQKEFCDLCAGYIGNTGNELFEKDIITLYEQVYSTVGKSENAIQKGAMLLHGKYAEYIEFLLNTEGKEILTVDEMNIVQTIYNECRTNIVASGLLFDDMLDDGVNSINEGVYKYIFNDVEMKSKYDRLILDYETKLAIIVDFKTYSHKSIKESPYQQVRKSINDYSYDRQLAFYKHGIDQFLINDIDDWKIKVFIVAAQTNLLNEVQVFEISDETLSKGLVKGKTLINDYKHLDFEDLEPKLI